jgi:hypothetical protein
MGSQEMNKNNLIFCTYFDYSYLLQGFALIDSIKMQMHQSIILVLCLDDKIEKLIKNFYGNQVLTINITDLQNSYEELLQAKGNRNRVEYIFTLTPFLIDYAFDNVSKEFDFISYVDADTYFFREVESTIFQLIESSNYSILLSKHNYTPKLQKKYEKYGIFNVGILTFRNDNESRKCVNWWKSQCIEHCPDTPTNGRFADQKYLEGFFDITPNISEYNDPGVNLAPWNISNFLIQHSKVGIVVDKYPLKFFHFHNLKFRFSLFFPLLDVYKASLEPVVKSYIYVPYLEHLISISNSLNLDIQDFFKVKVKRGVGFIKYLIYLRSLLYLIRSLLTCSYISVKKIIK